MFSKLLARSGSRFPAHFSSREKIIRILRYPFQYYVLKLRVAEILFAILLLLKTAFFHFMLIRPIESCFSIFEFSLIGPQ